MSGSAELYQRLKLNVPQVTIKKNIDTPLGGWEDSFIVNGAHRECYPEWVATPIGPSPYGFLVCQRKPDPVADGNYPKTPLEVDYSQTPEGQCNHYTQSYNMYSNIPNAIPRYSPLGNQALNLPDRRLPHQAHLQGLDYYRDAIRYRGVGVEDLDKPPGSFGYRENKFYFSSPPPRYDITQGVQPYNLWRREQLLRGNFTEKEMQNFEKEHTYVEKSSVY